MIFRWGLSVRDFVQTHIPPDFDPAALDRMGTYRTGRQHPHIFVVLWKHPISHFLSIFTSNTSLPTETVVEDSRKTRLYVSLQCHMHMS